MLWTLGDADLMSRPCIAIVGARIASAGGQRSARGLARQLGEAGHVVVSGLARGIDGAAHAGALPTGTVAVLGSGVDDVYPPDTADLYRQIAEQGCTVSESPVGAKARAKDFPRRNRIVSGLSRGVIVVEVELRSGSLITARLAGEQGRDVFAVPGSPLDRRSRGPNELLRQGAILCERLEDVERAFSTLRTLHGPEADKPFSGAADEADAALIERIAALLSPTPTPRDELARAVAAPIGAVAAALLELSLAGRATLLPGGLASSQGAAPGKSDRSGRRPHGHVRRRLQRQGEGVVPDAASHLRETCSEIAVIVADRPGAGHDPRRLHGARRCGGGWR